LSEQLSNKHRLAKLADKSSPFKDRFYCPAALEDLVDLSFNNKKGLYRDKNLNDITSCTSGAQRNLDVERKKKSAFRRKDCKIFERSKAIPAQPNRYVELPDFLEEEITHLTIDDDSSCVSSDSGIKVNKGISPVKRVSEITFVKRNRSILGRRSGLIPTQGMFDMPTINVGLNEASMNKVDDLMTLISSIASSLGLLDKDNNINEGFDAKFKETMDNVKTTCESVTGVTSFITNLMNELPTAKQIGVFSSTFIIGYLLMHSYHNKSLISGVAAAALTALATKIYTSDKGIVEELNFLISKITNYIIHFIPSVFETQMMDNIVCDVLYWLFRAIVGKSSTFYSKLSLGNIYNFFANFEKTSKSFEFSFDYFTNLFKTFINFIMEKVFKREAYFEMMSGSTRVDAWAAGVKEFADRFNDGKIIINLENFEAYNSLRQTGEQLLYDLNTPDLYKFRTFVTTKLHALTNIGVGFSNANFHSNGPRMAPLNVLFRGAPGVGKSFGTYPFCVAMLARTLPDDLLPAFEAKYEDMVFNRQAENVYWDGYFGQWLTVYDDFGQALDVVGSPDNEYMNFLRSGSLFPHNLHMAELSRKGKGMNTSKMVVLSTNIRNFDPKSIFSIEALERRFDIVVDVCPKEEYCLPGYASLDVWTRRLDKTKLTSDFDMDIYEFHEYSFRERRYTGRVWNFQQLVDHSADSYEQRKASHAHYSEGIKSVKEDFLAQRYSPRPQAQDIPPYVPRPPVKSNPTERTMGNYRPKDFIAQRKKKDSLPESQGMFSNYKITDFGCAKDERFDIRVCQVIKKLIHPPDDVPLEQVELCYDIIAGIASAHGLQQTADVCAVIIREFLTFFEQMLSEFVNPDAFKRIKAAIITKSSYIDLFLDADGEYLNQLKNIYMDWGSFWKETVAMMGAVWGQMGAVMKTYLVCVYGYIGYRVMKSVYGVIRKAITWIFPRKAITEPRTIIESLNIEDENSVWYTEDQLGYSGFPSEEKGGFVSEYNHSKTGRQLKMHKSHKPVTKINMMHLDQSNTYSSEMLLDKASDDIMKKVLHKSCYLMSFDGCDEKAGIVTFVCDTICIMPFHFLLNISLMEPTVVIIFAKLNNGTKTTLTVDQFVRCEYVEAVKNDAAYIKMPDCFQKHIDIRDYFMPEKLIAQMDRSRITLNGYRDGHYKIRSRCMLQGATQVYDNPSDTTIDLGRSVFYEGGTVRGDCGSLLSVSNTMTANHKILGMHVAGKNEIAIGAILTLEDVQEAVKQFGQIIVPEDPMPVTQFNLPGNIPFESYYEVAKAPRDCNYTQLKRTQLYGTLIKPTKAPAHLSPFTNEEGELIDPMIMSCRKYYKEYKCLDQYLIDVAMDDVFSQFAKAQNIIGKIQPRVLTFREAVAGIPGRDFVDSIPRKTSAGYPECLNIPPGMKGKEHIFGTADEYDFERPEAKRLEAECNAFEESCALGILPDAIFRDFPKDELRPFEKVDAGKTRRVSGAPIVLTIVTRKFLLDFMAQFMAARIINGSAVGVDVYSEEWHIIYKLITTFGEDGIMAGDYGDYDSSHHGQFASAMLRNIIKWYGYEGRNAVILSSLFVALINSKHLWGLLVYIMCGTLPSGHPFTTLFNTIIVLTLPRMVYLTVQGMDFEQIKNFDNHVKVLGYGDDTMMGVHPTIRDKFNHFSYRDTVVKYGYRYTPAHKGDFTTPFDTFESVTFLKRKFEFHKSFRRIVAPLELETVLQICYWVDKSNNTEGQLAQNVQVTLRELMLHGKTIYDKWSNKIQRVTTEFGDTVFHIPTFEAMFAKCCKDEAFVCRLPCVEEDKTGVL